MKNKLVVAMAVMCSGCIVSPQVVTRYDAICDVEYRHMQLSVEPVNLLNGGASCTENCGPVLAFYALAAPVTAVVSGSIVLAGNSLFWVQRDRDCLS